MPTEVIMPKVDMDMASGTISAWHVAPGEAVERGAPLFDIETDKAAMEVEAPASGILRHPLAIGTETAIGAPVAWLYEPGEAVEALPDTAPVQTKRALSEKKATPAKLRPAPVAINGKGARATPVARRLAAEAGIDLATLTGSGPRGRIQKADVEAALEEPDTSAEPENSLLAAYADREFSDVPLDNMRHTVAARLSEAKQSVPHFYLRRRARIDRLIGLRAELNQALAGSGLRVTVNDFVIKAVASALQEIPDANAIWAGDRILRFARSDIAVAVAVEGGLFTPVLRDADDKSIRAISTEMKALAVRAHNRNLAPADYTGGSITISNLGMYGVESFDAIINPPHAAILAVGAGLQTQTGEGTAVIMSLTLSVDHRVIDGALGARLLAAIVDNLETPVSCLA